MVLTDYMYTLHYNYTLCRSCANFAFRSMPARPRHHVARVEFETPPRGLLSVISAKSFPVNMKRIVHSHRALASCTRIVHLHGSERYINARTLLAPHTILAARPLAPPRCVVRRPDASWVINSAFYSILTSKAKCLNH